MLGKFNERIAIVIISVLACSIFLNAVSINDTQAQGLSNQTVDTLAAQQGTATEADRRGYVKVTTTCKLNNMSCAGIADDIFLIRAFVFGGDNRLFNVGEFPPSERGRTVQFDTFAGPIAYQINQDVPDISAQRLFHIYPSYSYDCQGEIQPGQTKECKINTTLYTRN